MKKIFALILVFSFALSLASCGENKSADGLFDTVCSADDALEKSKAADVVVFEDGRLTSGGEVWDSFYNDANDKKSASVLLAHYYTLDKEHVSAELYEEEKDNYPKLFFYSLEYDGEVFNVTTRESTADETEYRETFKYLLHFTGKAPSTALFSNYDNYVLVDDPEATWEGIEAGLFSSQSDAGYKHCTVYNNYIYDSVKDGIYTKDGDEESSPYVFFNTDDMSWHCGASIATSWSLGGKYTVTGDKIFAKDQDRIKTEIEFQIISATELKVVSVALDFFPEGNWISDGETYLYRTFDGTVTESLPVDNGVSEFVNVPVLDRASFDIDGDGTDEECTVSYGPTSGLFTFVVTSYADGQIKYQNTFNYTWCKISFRTEDGKIKIVFNIPDEVGAYTEKVCDIGVKDGDIVIDDFDGEYWGKSIENDRSSEGIGDGLILKEENKDNLINVSNDKLLSVVSSFQLMGYMNSAPFNYDEIKEMLNSNDSSIKLFGVKVMDILTDGDNFCFMISELNEGEYEPCGIIYAEKIYKYDEAILEEIDTEQSDLILKYLPLIISPSLSNEYDADLSFYILTDKGMLKYRFDSSEKLCDIELIENQYIDRVLVILFNTID